MENNVGDKVKEYIFQDVDSRLRTKEALNHYAYYIMIVIVSLLVIFVPPLLLGAIHGDVGLAFPTTPEGWILWALIDGSMALANIAILSLFKLQAKKNVKDHPKYLEANEILDRVQDKKILVIPRSPKQMNTQDYIKKVIAILISTIGSSLAVTSLMLSFDVYTLVSTLLSTVITIILSWSAMMKDEHYWTNEYLLYAKYIEDKLTVKEEPVEQNESIENIEEPIAEGVNENVEFWEQRI